MERHGVKDAEETHEGRIHEVDLSRDVFAD